MENISINKTERSKVLDWPISSGYYGETNLTVHPSEIPDLEKLTGIELTIKKRILSMLKIYGDRYTDNNPLTVVDFGGGLSLSFLKIAREISQIEEVNKKVRLVVTNLEEDGQSFIESIKELPYSTNKTVLALELFKKNRETGIVEYIKGGSEELSLFLKGAKIDILHERNVFRHSRDDSGDIKLLGSLISDVGCMLLDSGPEMKESDTERTYRSKRDAHESGLKSLSNFSLVTPNFGGIEMNYLVYQKKESLPIEE